MVVEIEHSALRSVLHAANAVGPVLEFVEEYRYVGMIHRFFALVRFEIDLGLVGLDGTIVDEPDIHHQRLHYVGHHDAVKPMLSVYENIAFWAALRQTDEHVADALDAFDISHLAEVPGRFLSAGQKRRLNLARILAVPAKLWLLDEPTTALDVATVSRFEQVLFQHRESGGMVIASSHTTLGLDGADTLRLDDFKAKQVFDETLY